MFIKMMETNMVPIPSYILDISLIFFSVPAFYQLLLETRTPSPPKKGIGDIIPL